MMFNTEELVPITAAIALTTALLVPYVANSASGVGGPTYVDQGIEWTETARQDFYRRDQGSRIIPIRWILALKQANGEPFVADGLNRYGYLVNEKGLTPGLPVGFTITDDNVGMTCSACHTREIEVAGVSYRIDGGPAIADFQSMLADLDVAVGTVIDDQAAFKTFAQLVLGPESTSADQQRLLTEVRAWYLRFHTLVERALPKDPWGPSRLDAVSMIFNRVTGLDIGPPPSYIIAENIHEANAPVRYPFLWNAAKQDKTQWPGFADNGDNILGLARNLGEVYGVFGVFHPKKDRLRLLGINYLHDNSADFQGLLALEDLIRKIGPPKWPVQWPLDMDLARVGEQIFDRSTDEGGCVECHGIKKGETRFPFRRTWATPIMDVGTDSREYAILGRTATTGVLEGAKIPILTEALKPTDKAFNVLRVSVIGSILQRASPLPFQSRLNVINRKAISLFSDQTEALKGAFRSPESKAMTPSIAYESRVLEGIWAAAPYLHNGSVPTLVELLKPASERVASFKVGPAYDIENVGLAVEQDKFDYTLNTTDCSKRDSGNSRCGHEFGTTTLSPDEKKALLEYLKVL
jgi:hypothetical protein